MDDDNELNNSIRPVRKQVVIQPPTLQEQNTIQGALPENESHIQDNQQPSATQRTAPPTNLQPYAPQQTQQLQQLHKSRKYSKLSIVILVIFLFIGVAVFYFRGKNTATTQEKINPKTSHNMKDTFASTKKIDTQLGYSVDVPFDWVVTKQDDHTYMSSLGINTVGLYTRPKSDYGEDSVEISLNRDTFSKPLAEMDYHQAVLNYFDIYFQSYGDTKEEHKFTSKTVNINAQNWLIAESDPDGPEYFKYAYLWQGDHGISLLYDENGDKNKYSDRKAVIRMIESIKIQ